MSVDHTPDTPSPRLNLQAVTDARAVLRQDDVLIPRTYLRDLLGAYDTLAAKHALLAAEYAAVIAIVGGEDR